MSYFSKLDFIDGAKDPFGRLRVSNPYTILDLKQLYDKNPLFYTEYTESTGSITYDVNKAQSTLKTGEDGTAIKQSKTRGTYQPGKGLLIIMTCNFNGSITDDDDITSSGRIQAKRCGYFDDNNGLFFEASEGTFWVVNRSSVSGPMVDMRVRQSEWNIDKMDGTGPSRKIFNGSNANIFVIDFEYLGVGRVRFYLNIDGEFYKVHEFNNANNKPTVYMSNSNLPLRWEINGGNNSSMTAICGSIISEGGKEDISFSTYVSRGNTDVTVVSNVWYPLLGVRLRNDRLSTRVNPLMIDVFCGGTGTFEWALVYQPSSTSNINIGTGTWTDISSTYSSVQYVIPAGTPTITIAENSSIVNGQLVFSAENSLIVAGGYGSSTAQSKNAITQIVKTFLTLGSSVLGTPDAFFLVAKGIGGNATSMTAGITLGEYV